MDKKSSKGLLHTLNQSARKLLPLSLQKATPDSDEELLHIYRNRDAKSNKDSTPPDNEVINLCCIWAVEFYTPSHMNALLAGVRRFGWEEEGFYSLKDIEEWVNRSRKHPLGSGWHGLGAVRTSGTNNLTKKQVHRDALPPPKMIEASGQMFSLTSSLACVVMKFTLSEDLSAGFDTALRTDRQTYFTTLSDCSRMMHSPDSQKASHILQIRAEAKKSIATWISVNLPGLFSSGLLEGDIPTCELVTMCQVEPFPNSGSSAKYLRLLDLDSNINVWSSVELPILKFSLSLRSPIAPRYHSVFATKTDAHGDGEVNDLKSCSSRRDDIVFVNNVVASGLLGWWAILPMLEGFGKHLSATLQSPILKLGSVKDSVTVLRELAQHVTHSIETNAVANEIQLFSNNQYSVGQRLHDFVLTIEGFSPDGFTLENHLCSLIAERAAWIQRMDRSLRDHGGQYGALVGAMENVRLQRQIKYFTIALTALTIVLLLEASSVQIFLKELYKWLQGIWVFLRGLGM